MKTFMSDNTASVHPKVMEAIIAANHEHAMPYGGDPITIESAALIQGIFGGNCTVSFVLNGTGANVIGLASLLKPYEAVICPTTAHINCDECGAFERYTGAKLIQVETKDGKLRIDDIKPLLSAIGNEHHNQPKVVSITQITEMGTIYSISELKMLADFVHEQGLLLHVDGARIANAAVALGVTFKEMITDTGVDLLSFGAAKNGLMYGEAIVSFHSQANTLKFIRKQGMQLMSKMRYIAAQYKAILSDNLMYDNAKNANNQMKVLYEGLKSHKEIEFLFEPEANIAFAYMPLTWGKELFEKQYVYLMGEFGDKGYVRFVTSFDTEAIEIKSFLGVVQQLSKG